MPQGFFPLFLHQAPGGIGRRFPAAFGDPPDAGGFPKFLYLPEERSPCQHTGRSHGNIFFRPGPLKHLHIRRKGTYPFRDTFIFGKLVHQGPTAPGIFLPGLFQGRNMAQRQQNI